MEIILLTEAESQLELKLFNFNWIKKEYLFYFKKVFIFEVKTSLPSSDAVSSG